MNHLAHNLLKYERFVFDYLELLNSFTDGCNNIIMQLKEALHRIFWHDFCRFSEFERNERLNFKDQPFGYFRLLLYFSKKLCGG